MTVEALYDSEIKSLPLINRGKVRDIYHVDDEHMLIVTTDRLSAFDVILPDPVPGKGAVLTTVSNFWFQRTKDLIPNHLSHKTLEDILGKVAFVIQFMALFSIGTGLVVMISSIILSKFQRIFMSAQNVLMAIRNKLIFHNYQKHSGV